MKRFLLLKKDAVAKENYQSLNGKVANDIRNKVCDKEVNQNKHNTNNTRDGQKTAIIVAGSLTAPVSVLGTGAAAYLVKKKGQISVLYKLRYYC